eukprot:TRINITY_DN3468_c4_g1_i1.p1 TRINITY_DN3468_c4_g1~~TRINITY_DN3468_c4_g1_i1.p1  ORF type:complete len:316 (+),score=27.10 TRINITY_DN3468_c4_g1_i1:116-1063(+)
MHSRLIRSTRHVFSTSSVPLSPNPRPSRQALLQRRYQRSSSQAPSAARDIASLSSLPAAAMGGPQRAPDVPLHPVPAKERVIATVKESPLKILPSEDTAQKALRRAFESTSGAAPRAEAIDIYGDACEWMILVVSDVFLGMPLRDRVALVQACLAEAFPDTKVRPLRIEDIKLRTREEHLRRDRLDHAEQHLSYPFARALQLEQEGNVDASRDLIRRLGHRPGLEASLGQHSTLVPSDKGTFSTAQAGGVRSHTDPFDSAPLGYIESERDKIQFAAQQQRKVNRGNQGIRYMVAQDVREDGRLVPQPVAPTFSAR